MCYYHSSGNVKTASKFAGVSNLRFCGEIEIRTLETL